MFDLFRIMHLLFAVRRSIRLLPPVSAVVCRSPAVFVDLKQLPAKFRSDVIVLYYVRRVRHVGNRGTIKDDRTDGGTWRCTRRGRVGAVYILMPIVTSSLVADVNHHRRRTAITSIITPHTPLLWHLFAFLTRKYISAITIQHVVGL